MTRFVAPSRLSQALDEISGRDAVLVGGGTSLAVLLKQRMLEPELLVWLGRVAGLKGIRRTADGWWHIGAATTLAEVARSPELRHEHPMVTQAAGVVANPRIRHVATVGGAIVHADPRQDLPPALLAAGATVAIRGRAGDRTMPLGDGFFRGFLQTAVGPAEVVTHISLPPATGAAQTYRRFTPQSRDDYPTVSVAARMERTDSGEVSRWSLALGGVAPTPVLVGGVETALAARAPSAVDVATVSAAARAATSPISDERGSAEYKAAMAEVWTQRVLTELLERER
jgi:carbon-monoxide dehydrogenase medium subunit